MDQAKLFYESFLDALRDDVAALGGSKAVGELFWPGKSPEAQRNSVNDRLNAERRERFDDDQVRLIMRRARDKRGYSAALYFLCDDTGFDRPRAKDPEDERAKLQRSMIEGIETVRRLADQLERLATSPTNVAPIRKTA